MCACYARLFPHLQTPIRRRASTPYTKHTHTHNRETANAEYANRMAGADTLAAARNKACEIKVKTFTAVAASIDKQVRFRQVIPE